MTPWKIAVLDRATLAPEPFAFDFPAEVAKYPSTRPEETAARIAGADIVVTNKVVITAEHIAANPQLRLIAVAATGVNNVDTEAAKAAGVTVCNIRAYGNESVAEHAFMITLMRNLPAYQRDIAAGIWEQSPFFCHFGAPMRDLHGKTLAVFGRGNIGKTLAGYARAFGMNVVFGEHKHAENVREGYVSFDEAIRTADAVSLHCPLTPQTANMIGEMELQRMKPGTVLINCGRASGRAGFGCRAEIRPNRRRGFRCFNRGAAAQQQPAAQSPPAQFNRYAAYGLGSEEARHRLFAILLENINRFAAGQPQNVVA